nr:immunoglobulin light chain junction region [Macaca mulatta]MOX83130.1 immunoglobulin light chain junction region [Macaca mulatta]
DYYCLLYIGSGIDVF